MKKLTFILVAGALLPAAVSAQTRPSARVDTIIRRSAPLGTPVPMPEVRAARARAIERILENQQLQSSQRLRATQQMQEAQRRQLTQRLEATRRTQEMQRSQLAERVQSAQRMQAARSVQGRQNEEVTRGQLERLRATARFNSDPMLGRLPELRNRLDLTDKQIQEMREVSQKEQKKMNEKRMKFEREMRKEQEETQKKMMDVLTKEQRREYEQMRSRGQGGRNQM